MGENKYGWFLFVAFFAGCFIGIIGTLAYQYFLKDNTSAPFAVMGTTAILLVLGALILLISKDGQMQIDSFGEGIKQRMDAEFANFSGSYDPALVKFGIAYDTTIRKVEERVALMTKHCNDIADNMRNSYLKTEATRTAYRNKIMLHAYSVAISRLRNGDAPEYTDQYIKKMTDDIHNIDNDPEKEGNIIFGILQKRKAEYIKQKTSQENKAKIIVCRECKSPLICPKCGKLQVERGDIDYL